MHECEKAVEIAELKVIVKDLSHSINGNGKPGLRDSVTELTTIVKALSEDLKSNTTAVNAVRIMQAEYKGEQNATATDKKNYQWVVNLAFSTVLAIITIYVAYKTNH